MSDSTLYDDDILLWSEQQAAAIRRLRETARGLPNELDIENVAEEIESVGKRELWAVEENTRSIFLHLIRLVVEPNAGSAPQWRAEMFEFHCRIKDRYAPSMRQRVDMDDLWRSARYQLTLAYGKTPAERDIMRLPDECPFEIDDIIADEIDNSVFIERIQASNALSLVRGRTPKS